MDYPPEKERMPLRAELVTFAFLAVFFAIVAGIYTYVAELEVIGSTAFTGLALMSAMIAAYLWLVGRRIEPRWEDRVDAEISEATGEVGVFSPTSWWPLIAGAGAALVFLALAIGFWILVPGVIVTAIGVIGMAMEFSRGQHAH
ncbi:MAG TPA: cytochrome c oxidase subunit 4 [Actinomycetaceae bacterium]|nr:cytochrome c oxidase subunit 4 [Actinomycetaceae bacterium]